MKKIVLDPTWHETWKYSYPYDLLEIYSDTSSLGYAYAYETRRNHILELIQKVAKPSAKILDIAAAQGNFSLLLAELGYEVTWNDLRAELIDYVKLKWERGQMSYAPGNVLSQKFDSEFDVILMGEVIEHVAHPDEFLREISKFLKPNGHIVMTTPNGEYFLNRLPKFSDCPDPSQYESIQFQPNSDGHIFLLHLDELEPIASQAGLSVIETRIFTNPLTNGHLKTRYLLKILPKSFVDGVERFTRSLPFFLAKKINTGLAVLLTRKD